VELTKPVTEHLRLGASAASRTQSLNREARTFRAVALSGQPIPRIDPLTGREFMLRFDPAGGDFGRIAAGTCPLLNSHRDGDMADRIGYVRAAQWQDGSLVVECQLGASDASERLLADLEAGIPAAVSLGVLLRQWKDSRDKNGRLTERVVTQWEVFEVSVVPVPADGAAVTLSFQKLEDETMQEQNREELFDASAAAAERARIVELGRIAKAAKLSEQLVAQHIEAGTSVDEFRRIALEELAKRSEAWQPAPRIEMVRDEGDTRREGLALALRHRINGGELPEHARPYAFTRLPDAARECLKWKGERLVGMSDARVVQLAMSTSDFPNILANVANKTLLDAYQAAPAVLKQICRQTTAADFKEKRVLRFGEGTGLALKPEGAEYTYGSIAEQTSSYSVKTFGRIFAFTREMIVNDDLGALDQFFRAAGRLAVEFEARILSDLLTANGGSGPILSDGLPLFHANHGNVAATGGAISVETLDAARAALRRQKGLDGGVIIDADPRFLIVPVSKQTTAEQVTASIVPAQTANVNPFAGRLSVLADPHLDDASTTAWYVAADPANVPVFEFAYLQGAQGPQTETENDFDRDVLKFKVRLDVGAGVVDWRGIFRNSGA